MVQILKISLIIKISLNVIKENKINNYFIFIYYILNLSKTLNFFQIFIFNGDWGLGIGPNPQSPIPNPQSPIPKIKVLSDNTKLF